MIPIASGVRVWIATGHTDMRRGMNSLGLLVQEAFKRNPHGGDLYVFRGKSGKLIKILWHDGLACRSTPSDWSAAGSFGHRLRFDLDVATRLYAGRNRLEKSAAHVASDGGRMSVNKAAAH